MSLINDALKRAHQNQPPPAAAPGAPMLPVIGAPAVVKPHLNRVVQVLILVMVGASGFFFWKWQQARRAGQVLAVVQQSVSADPTQIPPAARSVVDLPAERDGPSLAVESAPRSVVGRVVAAGPVVVAPTASPGPSVQPAPAGASSVAVVPAAVPANIKLQAILFRLRNPTAILNGRTLEVGESVDGAKVVEIQRSLVVIERGGRRETLELR
jgi:MSHA biogenesis protein MshK